MLIDFYGTVADGDRAVVERVCANLIARFDLDLAPPQLAERWGERFFAATELHNGDNYLTLFECECASLLETLEPLVGRFDPRPFVEALRAYWRQPPLHPEAREALAAVTVPTCCVSNADRAEMEQALRYHRLDFDYVVTSEDARSYKPDARIFRTALEQTAWRAENVLHVGDSLHADVFGAQRLGIGGVWVCRPNRIHDIGQTRARHTIRDLLGLPGVCAEYT